ncbi:MAG: hypothetical protein GXP38_07755 [Chloroflexi bacterium]|nr:hypothetical protein [Chloroflexota bacterium]
MMPPARTRWTQLLTIWQENVASARQPTEWRFVLEDVHSGERHGFASLEALMAFLQKQMVDAGRASSDD